MKRLALICTLIFAGFTVQASESCGICEQNHKLTQSFTTLSFAAASDRERGMDAIDSVVGQLRKSQKGARAIKGSEDRGGLFDSMIDLVFAASPYDMESQASQVLSDIMMEFPQLKARFAQMVKGERLSCNQKLVKAQVTELLCQEESRRKKKLKPSEFDGDASCVRSFNYEDCLRKPSSSSVSKPR